MKINKNYNKKLYIIQGGWILMYNKEIEIYF